MPSLGYRAVALLAAVLVIALSVFAANAEWHAWLHSHQHGDSSQHPVSGEVHAEHQHETPETAGEEDGCAVILFAQGILLAAFIFVLGIFGHRILECFRRLKSASGVETPRHWLPPLCGPPLN